MKVLIVFESMFGNTACDLLVLAAPTHALPLSRPASRAEAVSNGADPARAATGLREWLSMLDTNRSSRAEIAVVDTRVHKGSPPTGIGGEERRADLEEVRLCGGRPRELLRRRHRGASHHR